MTYTPLAARRSALAFAIACLACSAMASEPDQLLFVGDHGSYVGRYGLHDQSLAVVIDGMSYAGHFSGKDSEPGSPAEASSPPTGRWGRAFLFASSAKVLQCTLDTGFPAVSGRCQDADGHPFTLKTATKP